MLPFQYLGAVISRCSGLCSCCEKKKKSAVACESGSSDLAAGPIICGSSLRGCSKYYTMYSSGNGVNFAFCSVQTFVRTYSMIGPLEPQEM